MSSSKKNNVYLVQGTFQGGNLYHEFTEAFLLIFKNSWFLTQPWIISTSSVNNSIWLIIWYEVWLTFSVLTLAWLGSSESDWLPFLDLPRLQEWTLLTPHLHDIAFEKSHLQIHSPQEDGGYQACSWSLVGSQSYGQILSLPLLLRNELSNKHFLHRGVFMQGPFVLLFR